MLVDVVRAELDAVGHGKVAVIAPADQLAGVHAELTEHLGEWMTSPDGHPLRAPLVVMDPTMSKGLEFDTVVLVEPTAIQQVAVGDLYVAMTRPTTRLHGVYRDELPEGWLDGE